MTAPERAAAPGVETEGGGQIELRSRIGTQDTEAVNIVAEQLRVDLGVASEAKARELTDRIRQTGEMFIAGRNPVADRHSGVA